MDIHSLQFKGHSCFKYEWSSIPSLKPLCVIIGKNNTGKSHYLKIIKDLCKMLPSDLSTSEIFAEAILDESSLKGQFREGLRSSKFSPYQDEWFAAGKEFKNELATWNNSNGNDEIEFPNNFAPAENFNTEAFSECLIRIKSLFLNANHVIHGRYYRELLADRDIQPEASNNTLELSPNGDGATNIVRKFINSTDPNYPRDLIRVSMLRALNQIFAEDGHFREILIQQIDGTDPKITDDLWEIYLVQDYKGLVALSESGSSLKTVFLVLINILIIPKIRPKIRPKNKSKSLADYAFAFEELENNLHPSLLRRLLAYIESHIKKDTPNLVHSHPIFFLTTHSNVALDYFAGQEHAQIVHITHNGKSAKAELVSQSSKQLEVLRDLGSKPSDLLQANGIIWVEGPSDRIYINKWIELWSNGKFEEGRHYQCMFYGGGLIANLDVAYTDEAPDEFINLLTINPNVVVVTDSDRKSKNAHFKPRVKRIRDSFEKLNETHAFHWLLKAREIENYLTGDLINHALTKKMTSPKDPTQFESFFPKQSEKTNYLESKAKRKSMDKSKLAMITTSEMNKADLIDRFDLNTSMDQVISMIREWNK